MNDFIANTRWYSVCWISFFFLAGILIYILDRQYLQGMYKSIYDITHKSPLTKARAWVFGQSTSRKFVIATAISTLQSVGLFFFTGFHSNPFVELVLWAVEIPAMVLGFAAGFWVFPWWEKRTKFYSAMDELDRQIEEHVQGGGEKIINTTPPAETQAEINEESKPPVESPEERIRRFSTRRQM